MDEFERHERKREAWMRLRAQRRRAGELRGRVVAISVVCFALLWAVVFAQMVSGNDPVLSQKAAARASSQESPKKGKGLPEEEVAAEPEVLEPEFVEPEEEAEFVEPEVTEPEFVEPEEAETEFVEPEPLVTSQS